MKTQVGAFILNAFVAPFHEVIFKNSLAQYTQLKSNNVCFAKINLSDELFANK